ncbi:MAG: hypothetical protein AB4290_08210 [Spirulina sp.]
MAGLQNLNEAGVALQEYDPVSYFSDRPVKGNTKPQWEADPQTRKNNADAHWQSGDLNVVYPTIDY